MYHARDKPRGDEHVSWTHHPGKGGFRYLATGIRRQSGTPPLVRSFLRYALHSILGRTGQEGPHRAPRSRGIHLGGPDVHRRQRGAGGLGQPAVRSKRGLVRVQLSGSRRPVERGEIPDLVLPFYGREATVFEGQPRIPALTNNDAAAIPQTRPESPT